MLFTINIFHKRIFWTDNYVVYLFIYIFFWNICVFLCKWYKIHFVIFKQFQMPKSYCKILYILGQVGMMGRFRAGVRSRSFVLIHTNWGTRKSVRLSKYYLVNMYELPWDQVGIAYSFCPGGPPIRPYHLKPHKTTQFSLLFPIKNEVNAPQSATTENSN